jgi:LAO/AO transport system kinase
MWQESLQQIQAGNIRALARTISLIENEGEGYEELLRSLPSRPDKKLIGITGPPGAGKSTLVNSLIGEMVAQGKKVAVLCVDPSSPFNLGAVLGDRIRMSDWYTHPSVFIRSLATRGSLGGLHPKILEITELLKQSPYDRIIVETVGVGQSEIEIVGLADTTVVVLVPEAGDEVQTMKAGLMEIADIFVVNKGDRPDADAFLRHLRLMLAPAFHSHAAEVPVLRTSALQGSGITELLAAIDQHQATGGANEKRFWLLAERAWFLIQQRRMRHLRKEALRDAIRAQGPSFNLYQFVADHAG